MEIVLCPRQLQFWSKFSEILDLGPTNGDNFFRLHATMIFRVVKWPYFSVGKLDGRVLSSMISTSDGIKTGFFQSPDSGLSPDFEVNYPVFPGPTF